MPPSCQCRLASRRAAAPRACAAGARGGRRVRNACHAERSRSISRACWCPLMVSLSNHAAYAPVVPVEAGTSAALFDVGVSLVGAYAPRHASEGWHPDVRLRRAHAQPGARGGAWDECLSCRAKPRHLSGVLVPAHGEPVEPRRVCPRRSCGGRNLAALSGVGASLVDSLSPDSIRSVLASERRLRSGDR